MGNFSEKKAFETKLEQMLKEVETQAAEIAGGICCRRRQEREGEKR